MNIEMPDLSKYLNKKVLVTGGSGFIGSLACEALIKLGAEVHSVSRQSMDSNNGVRWWQGDLVDYEWVRNLFNNVGPDIVIHLASEVTGKREIEFVLPTMNGNMVSAINLMICATELNCERIILAGSLEEPDCSDPDPIPSSPYAAAKWASSAYARMFFNLYKTPVVIARLFMVYGPHQKDILKLIPYVALSVLNNNVPKLANGKRPVDWIYVDDIVDGLLLMGLAKNIDGQTLELGSGELTTTGEVANLLCELGQVELRPEFGSIAERAMEQIRVAAINNTSEKIGWQPKVSLQKGLSNTLLFYKQQLDSGQIKSQ